MHVLFVHQNHPAQFGHVARSLAARPGSRCTFVSEHPPGGDAGVELVQYRIRGGATRQTHPFARTFENAMWHSHAIHEALSARPDLRPDLVVAHSGFHTAVLLRELYPEAPIINYFEYYYHIVGSDMDFRTDFPASEFSRLRARARNAVILLDLDNCDAGYAPTRWQRDRLPGEYHGKVGVIFDGIDTRLWSPAPERPRHVAGLAVPRDVKVVTYATRGMESMRGFDIFMRAANRVARRRADVLFVVAGEDRVCYGGDSAVTGGLSFKDWVLAREPYDLDRFRFVGLLPPHELARLFRRTDAHVYLTVPFVLSWSLFNALACGAPVLASATPPVQEVVEDGVHGRLVDFFDVEALADAIEALLDAPDTARALGDAGAALVRERYDQEVCLPRMIELYERTLARGRVAVR
jgi:glycosyltransferase involved in cell wall biosynthesis